MKKHPEWQPEKPAPVMKSLGVLVGNWDLMGMHPMIPTGVRGRASFEWLDGDGLLIQRTDMEQPGPPNSVSAIGCDDSHQAFCMLYFDERGVSRIYSMSLEGNLWRMWRDAPGFSQRFTGTISHDGNTITALWEKSEDGSTWEHDLELTYTRINREE
ncbi:MAG: hypothetical protein ACM3PY_15540 [Omnitrophica WOR_2 bacterium]